jgi:hypothetical protein
MIGSLSLRSCLLVALEGSFALGLIILNLPVNSAPQWRITHFGTCFSDDSIMVADGSWWYLVPGGRDAPDRTVYGGSYVTKEQSIATRDYVSMIDAQFTVTGVKLQRLKGDGSPKFYLPIKYVNKICGF